MSKVVSVFGSGSPLPGSADYEAARQMGQLLAEVGYTVQTGGYGGLMAATSQGANEAGGHVIGITCSHLETVRPLPANDWVVEEIKCKTLRQRLLYLVEYCAGVIALPGGIGTLAELALAWNLIQQREIEPKPIIAVGGQWARTLNAFIDPAYVPPEQAALVISVRTPKEAIQKLVEF
jgi:hypothetical protein